ncbi:glycoside hydrolase family 24 protein [Oscillatoria acuminata]|uniref:Muramidase (Phage lambda lysozyme) n=1 Tax=Oscillatoria acuminata PCC 6304 TaxID=56110 RepID=K9TL54_9CYAN|nr:glycoside hydrolase family 104 protein [Oscillatoria acuminata]AFY83597.1 muramidase (phage lambda lysozyme) [Oscillatoria acuminata PCC 6304]
MNQDSLKTPIPPDCEVIQLWLQQQPPHQRRDRRLWVREFLAFVRKPLAAVTLVDVRAFAQTLAARRIPPEQAQARLFVLKSLFAYGYHQGQLPINIPLQHWPKVRVKRPSPSGSAILTGVLSNLKSTFRQRFGRGPRKPATLQKQAAFWGGVCLAGVALAIPAHFNSQAETTEEVTIPQPALQVRRQTVASLKAAHVQAFLDTIAWAEGTAGPNAYRMQFTGTQFSGFQDHPREIKCGSSYGSRLCSDAAGKYQFLSTTWDRMAKKIGASDFSPANQDRAAIALLDEYGVLEDIEAGAFAYAAIQLIPVWPSFQDVGNGDRTRAIARLERVYEQKLRKHSFEPAAFRIQN